MSKGFAVEVPLRWSDMDAYGHVNNVQYLRLLEDARVTGFQRWFGQDRSVLTEGIVVSRHEIEYLAPLTFRVEPVTVMMWITHISSVGFDLAYEIGESAGGPPYAHAQSALVLYDFTVGRPRRVDAEMRQLLLRHHGDPIRFRWRTQ